MQLRVLYYEIIMIIGKNKFIDSIDNMSILEIRILEDFYYCEIFVFNIFRYFQWGWKWESELGFKFLIF